MQEFETQVGTSQGAIASLGDQLETSEKEILEKAATETARRAGVLRRFGWTIRRYPWQTMTSAISAGILLAIFLFPKRSR